MRSGEWLSGTDLLLVRAPCGAPRLWLDGVGELHDAIGVVRMYGLDLYRSSDLEVEELAVFVGEWIACAAERDGPVAIEDVHPAVRPCVCQLAPSALIDGEDEEIDELPA